MHLYVDVVDSMHTTFGNWWMLSCAQENFGLKNGTGRAHINEMACTMQTTRYISSERLWPIDLHRSGNLFAKFVCIVDSSVKNWKLCVCTNRRIMRVTFHSNAQTKNQIALTNLLWYTQAWYDFRIRCGSSLLFFPNQIPHENGFRRC